MNINQISYKFNSPMQASNRLQPRPSFSGNKKDKGPCLPHNLEPETKFSKRQAARSQYLGLVFLAGLALSGNVRYQNYIKSKYNIVTSECSSFNTRDEAMEYAKKKVTDALKEPKPYEYNVLIDNNNNIVNEFKGDSARVMFFYNGIALLKNYLADYGITCVHGHPDQSNNMTTPISLVDFNTLVTQPIEKECIVFNKKGEYSLLRKTDKFVPLDDEQIKGLERIYWRMMEQVFESNYPEKVLNRKLNINFSKSENAKNNAKIQYWNEIQNFQHDIKGIKVIDLFWREFASRLGLEYETNYSYLNNTDKQN